jgi:hypothetical protein
MRRSNSVVALVGLISSIVSAPSWSQDKPTICTTAETQNLDNCSDEVGKAAAKENLDREETEKAAKTAEAAKLVKKEAAKINTGPSGAAVESGAATTNDYIPFIQALLGTSPGGEDAGDNLGLEFSNFLPIPDSLQHKVTIQLLGSGLYSPLEDALLAADLTSEKDTLAKQVGANDDISVSVSVSRSTEGHGRSPGLNADLFYEILKTSVPDESLATKTRQEFGALLQAKHVTRSKLDSEGFTAITDETDRNAIIAGYERMELASHLELVQIRENLRATGFYTALELLSNNPQWSFIGNYRSRDELAGPDEWSATVKYEIGWPNLTKARKDSKCGDDNACFAKKLNNFLADPQTIKSRNHSPRFSLNLSYSERARYDYLLPNTTFEYSKESASSLTGSIAYGMFLSGTSADTNRIRMDISVTYEDVSDDPSKNDRGFAKATFTYPIGNGTFLSIGAVYATKPEYRGEVDKELSARAGLLYKFAGS